MTNRGESPVLRVRVTYSQGIALSSSASTGLRLLARLIAQRIREESAKSLPFLPETALLEAVSGGTMLQEVQG